MNEPVTKLPSACSAVELQEFESLVIEAGEVANGGLAAAIARARCLSFLRRGHMLAGIGGLKTPRATYRARVSRSADVALPENAFPFELGWVHVRPTFQGTGLSRPLCESLIRAAHDEGIYATSRATNQVMHRTLARLGFRNVGDSWPSAQNDGELYLFVKDASALA